MTRRTVITFITIVLLAALAAAAVQARRPHGDGNVAQALERAGRLYEQGELDRALRDREWVAGATYSLADALWTVAIARHKVLELHPLQGRPALTAWYRRVKARPSFDSADVWERVKPLKMLAMVARNLWPR